MFGIELSREFSMNFLVNHEIKLFLRSDGLEYRIEDKDYIVSVIHKPKEVNKWKIVITYTLDGKTFWVDSLPNAQDVNDLTTALVWADGLVRDAMQGRL